MSSLPAQIRVRDVSLRDGLQMEAPVPLADKLRLLESLVAAGVRSVEATAFVSVQAIPALADAEELATHLHRWPDVSFSALVANLTGARRAVAAGVTSVEYVVSASDGHSRANVRRDTSQAAASIAPIGDLVHQAGGVFEVIIATAWDCPFDGPTPMDRVRSLAEQAVRDGADRLCLADTIGTVTPGRMSRLMDAVAQVCADLPLGIHLHDTRGAGMATAFAALQGGVLDYDASVGGLGGCPFAPGATGNIATEELAYLCAELDVDTGLNLDRLIEAGRIAERIVGRPLGRGLLRAGGRPAGRQDHDGVV